MSDELLARFGFTKLVVRDLEKQKAFYRAVMGYGEGYTIKASALGRDLEEIIFSAPDGRTELILLQFAGEAPTPAGSTMIGFNTGDLEAFEARVLAAGGTVEQPIESLDPAIGKGRMAFYADPEGFLLEVLQMQS